MGLIIAIACGFAWFQFSDPFSHFLLQHAPAAYARQLSSNGPLILGGLMLCGLVATAGLQGSMTNQRTAGMWQSAPGRRVIGWAAHGAAFVVLMASIGMALQAVIGGSPLTAGMAALLAWGGLRPFKIFLGRATRPLRWFLAGRHVGLGGTSSFSGLLDEWANPWRPGQVLLGASLYDPKWIVGFSDDRHVCTIATNRAGKGRSVIIPNLITWRGSVLVIDPKGQNALVTAMARGKGGAGLTRPLGQTVRILDPLGEIRDPLLQDCKARFNPIAGLDPRADDYAERVELIADALVVPDTKGKDNFWDTSARSHHQRSDRLRCDESGHSEGGQASRHRTGSPDSSGWPAARKRPKSRSAFPGHVGHGRAGAGGCVAGPASRQECGRRRHRDGHLSYEMAGQHGHAPNPRRIGFQPA